MNKIYILFLLIIFTTTYTYSQTILSFTIHPVNPTPTDTITIIAECMFPSGPCDGSAIVNLSSGNTILGDGVHCMGMLAVICTDYDTIVIPPKPAGQYSLLFNLSAGHGFPCSPGILIDDTDTLTFTVEDMTGINNHLPKINFQILPNPSDGRINIKSDSEKESIIRFYSTLGKLIKTLPLNGKSAIECFLQQGFYLIDIESEDGNYVFKHIVE